MLDIEKSRGRYIYLLTRGRLSSHSQDLPVKEYGLQVVRPFLARYWKEMVTCSVRDMEMVDLRMVNIGLFHMENAYLNFGGGTCLMARAVDVDGAECILRLGGLLCCNLWCY